MTRLTKDLGWAFGIAIAFGLWMMGWVYFFQAWPPGLILMIAILIIAGVLIVRRY